MYITVPLQRSQQKPRGSLLCKCGEINVAFFREDLEMRTLGAPLCSTCGALALSDTPKISIQ